MRASYGRCKKKCDTCWRRAFHVRRSWRVDSRAPWHDTRFLFIDKVCTKESSAGIKTVMKFKKVEPEQFDCTKTTMRPFGCMELWAGNEKAHRSLDLAGLQTDVILLPRRTSECFAGASARGNSWSLGKGWKASRSDTSLVKPTASRACG